MLVFPRPWRGWATWGTFRLRARESPCPIWDTCPPLLSLQELLPMILATGTSPAPTCSCCRCTWAQMPTWLGLLGQWKLICIVKQDTLDKPDFLKGTSKLLKDPRGCWERGLQTQGNRWLVPSNVPQPQAMSQVSPKWDVRTGAGLIVHPFLVPPGSWHMCCYEPWAKCNVCRRRHFPKSPNLS